MKLAQISVDLLTADDVVVTPSRRSARHWESAFASEMRSRDLRAWRSPSFLPDATWLSSVWNEWSVYAAGRDDVMPRLLSPAQEAGLWQRVVADNMPADALQSAVQAGKSAMQAWMLAHRFHRREGLDASSLDAQGSAEARAFSAWCTAMQAHLAQENAITLAQLPTALAKRVRSGGELPPLPTLRMRRVVTLPILQPEPAFEVLLNALAERGISGAELSLGPEAMRIERCEFETSEGQWRAAASWAKDRCAQADRRGEVVVVVPDLHRVRHLVQRIFRETFLPHSIGDPFIDATTAFDFSLGIRLSEVPLVASALAWLRVSFNGIGLSELVAAVRGPFVAAPRAFHRDLRESGVQSLSIGQLRNVFDTSHAAHAFIDSWLTPPRSHLLPSQWAARAQHALATSFGFPGASLDRESLQAFSAWDVTLAGFARLDSIAGEIGQSQFVAMLTRQCSEHDFQAEGQGAPVQVVGLFESLGLRAHAMWVCGLDDATLPGVAETTPLLSATWQRAVGAGRATPPVMQQSAHAIWMQWRHSAPELIVSHAQHVDGAARQASALSAPLPVTMQPHHHPKAETNWPELESIDDSRGQPWVEVQTTRGVGIIQAQAQCPFSAYAAYRLGADGWPIETVGIDARTRGAMLHGALQTLFSQVHSQAMWLEAHTGQQQAWLDAAVNAGLAHVREPLSRSSQMNWPRTLVDALRSLIHGSLTQWLALDAARENPFEIAMLEAKQTLALADVALSVRLDRVDILASGDTVVMDYKTGQTIGVSALRTTEGLPSLVPQLPIYALALAHTADVRGVAWAQVHAREARLVGVAHASSGFLSNRQANVDNDKWDALRAHWATALSETMSEFKAGAASVAPLKRAFCGNCQRAALCRIEHSLEPLIESEADVQGEQDA